MIFEIFKMFLKFFNMSIIYSLFKKREKQVKCKKLTLKVSHTYGYLLMIVFIFSGI